MKNDLKQEAAAPFPQGFTELVDPHCIRRSIRNLRCPSGIPPRFCDILFCDNGEILLQVKFGKERYCTIRWDDVEDQVNAFKQQLHMQ